MKKKKVNSKRKGDVGEREFIEEFKLVAGVELKRNYDQAALAGHDVVVAKLDNDLARFIDANYAIEIKRKKQIKPSDLITFWDQAVRQASKIDHLPILAYRQDYMNWRMLFPLLWEYDKSIDGTADMSVIGCVNFIEWWRSYDKS